MRLHELTGRPHNPECLHCVLAPVILEFANAHPRKPVAHLVGDIAIVLGELIASGVFEAGQVEQLSAVMQFAGATMRSSANELLRELQLRRVER